MVARTHPFLRDGCTAVVMLDDDAGGEQMTADEFRAALQRLGFAESDAANDLGLSAAARFFGTEPKTVRNWAAKGPPAPVAVCLRLMLKLRLTAPKARKLLGDTHG